MPITDKSQHLKTYYIPQGEWVNVFNYHTFTGPKWVDDNSISLDNIPVLAKTGSFIPRKPGLMNTQQYNTRPLDVLYLPSTQPSTYTLYEDDGEDAAAISNNKFELLTFKSTGLKRTTHITIQSNGGTFTGRPARRQITFTLPNLTQKPVNILVDGKKIPVEDAKTVGIEFTVNAEWMEATKTLRIPVVFTNKKVEAIIRF